MPLSPHSSDIRLVKLEPGKAGDEISCHIRYELLNSKPVYNTLSYIWGDPHNISFIKLNGQDFPVTANLEVALQNLREEQVERTLWIDAICIN